MTWSFSGIPSPGGWGVPGGAFTRGDELGGTAGGGDRPGHGGLGGVTARGTGGPRGKLPGDGWSYPGMNLGGIARGWTPRGQLPGDGWSSPGMNLGGGRPGVAPRGRTRGGGFDLVVSRKSFLGGWGGSPGGLPPGDNLGGHGSGGCPPGSPPGYGYPGMGFGEGGGRFDLVVSGNRSSGGWGLPGGALSRGTTMGAPLGGVTARGTGWPPGEVTRGRMELPGGVTRG